MAEDPRGRHVVILARTEPGAWDIARVDFAAAPWAALEACADHTVFKTRAWMDFLVETQKIEPLILALSRAGRVAAYLVGGIMRKGLRIAASPFDGWTTSFQGLSTTVELTQAERLSAYRAVARYAFSALRCSYFQATDWRLDVEAVRAGRVPHSLRRAYVLDLARTEDQLFAGFDPACRRAFRKAEKAGVVVREARDPDAFVGRYYDQLVDVFAKQRLAPTYPKSRVAALVRHVHPTGNLLLLESVDADGRSLASAIFPAGRRLMVYWGGASYRATQSLRPNEPLFFAAMKLGRARGIPEFELGGGGAYKEKFGPQVKSVAIIHISRFKGLDALKDAARRCYRLGLRAKGLLRR